MRRKLLKIIGLSITATFFLPINFIFASTKKILNQNLTNEQKNIMFNEGTERPF